MPEKNEADEILAKLSSLSPLEDVPSNVSENFHAKLSELASVSQREKKSGWTSGANQFALAASFAAVFALGAVVTLNSGSNSTISQVTSGATSNNYSMQTDDQLLFSDGVDSPSFSADSSATVTNSGHDYTQIPADLYRQLNVGTTWNSIIDLAKTDKSCLESLQLNRITNLVDYGRFGEEKIRAVWSPVTSTSWYIYLLDKSCIAIDKKYFEIP